MVKYLFEILIESWPATRFPTNSFKLLSAERVRMHNVAFRVPIEAAISATLPVGQLRVAISITPSVSALSAAESILADVQLQYVK